jgi:hypothetical protein
MQKFLVIAALATALGSAANAQTTAPPAAAPSAPAPSAMPPAAMTPAAPSADPGAPLSGANSFTEAQAKSRIEQLGYTNITGLSKDVNGVWRGKASKSGQVQDVALDFRGNVVVGQN